MNHDAFERCIYGLVYQVLEIIPWKTNLEQVTEGVFSYNSKLPVGFSDNDIRSQIEVSYKKLAYKG